MIIKNRLEIIKGESVVVTYNNLLEPALNFIADGKAYADFLAIGRGGKETTSEMTNLEEAECVLPLVTDSFNFDPENGELFLNKVLVLDESDKTALEIVEVGLTADQESLTPMVANRFLANAGEPIFRDPGEEMTISVTTYLEMDSESDLFLTAGSNALVKLLLGGGMDGDAFYFARGNDDTPNSELATSNSVGLLKIKAEATPEIDYDSRSLRIKLSSNIGLGEVVEILLLVGDNVVARKNIKEISGVVDGLTIELVADDDNMVTIPKAGINAVTGVADSVGQAITEFETKMYATGFIGGYTQEFVDAGYDASTTMIMGRQEHKVAFIKDGAIRIFDFMGDECLEHITTRIDISNAELYMLFDKYLFIKIKRSETSYDILAYELGNKNTYWSRSFYGCSSGYPGTSRTDKWESWDLCQLGADQDNKLFLMFSTPSWLFAYRVFQKADYCFYSDQSIYSNVYTVDYITGMPASNRLPVCFASYDKSKDRAVVYKNETYMRYTDPVAIDITKNYIEDGYPRMAKNFLFAVDKQSKEIKCFSIDTEQSKTLSFPDATDIYVSKNLDYIGVTKESGVWLYYVDGSLNLYPFITPLPERDGATIEKFEIMQKVVLVWFSDGVIASIKLALDKFVVQSVEKGSGVTITYMADNTPGLGGEEINVDAEIGVEI